MNRPESGRARRRAARARGSLSMAKVARVVDDATTDVVVPRRSVGEPTSDGRSLELGRADYACVVISTRGRESGGKRGAFGAKPDAAVRSEFLVWAAPAHGRRCSARRRPPPLAAARATVSRPPALDHEPSSTPHTAPDDASARTFLTRIASSQYLLARPPFRPLFFPHRKDTRARRPNPSRVSRRKATCSCCRGPASRRPGRSCAAARHAASRPGETMSHRGRGQPGSIGRRARTNIAPLRHQKAGPRRTLTPARSAAPINARDPPTGSSRGDPSPRARPRTNPCSMTRRPCRT
jgi:hypothetical protein